MTKDLAWSLKDSHYLLKDTWATIRVDTCVRTDGVEITPYYVYEFPDWVCAMAITKDGKVVLERQYRHALGQTIVELPGGCVDKSDKDVQVAIERELLEETGYRFDSFEFLGTTSANPSTNTNTMHLFLAQGGERVQGQHLDEGEELEVFTASLEETVALLLEGGFVQSMHSTCLLFALMKLGKLALLT